MKKTANKKVPIAPARKLAVKKDVLKDLSARPRSGKVKGGLLRSSQGTSGTI